LRNILVNELKKKPAIFSFFSDPVFNSKLICFIIKHEIGTYKDQLFGFLYDKLTGDAIARDKLRVESIEVAKKDGLSVWVDGCTSLGIRLSGFKELLNPIRSFDSEKQLARLVFFPESIAKIAALQEVELVIVRDWAIAELGSIGHKYDPIEERSQAIQNRDALVFASLLENRQLPFLGTHDIVAHIAGLEKNSIVKLSKQSKRAKEIVSNFLSKSSSPSQASLILAFTIGVLLDRMAQPPNYNKITAELIMDNLLLFIEKQQTKEKFPTQYDRLMEVAFYSDQTTFTQEKITDATRLFLEELNILYS